MDVTTESIGEYLGWIGIKHIFYTYMHNLLITIPQKQRSPKPKETNRLPASLSPTHRPPDDDVHTGLAPLELSKLLTSTFGLSGRAACVGFQDEHGIVIPISLASSNNSSLLSPDALYQLLLTDSDDFLLPARPPQSPPQPQPQPEGVAGPLQHSPIGVTPTSSSSSASASHPSPPPPPQQQQQPTATTTTPSSAWQAPLARFLHTLAGQGVLTPNEHAVLQALVQDGHIALAAAYRVAAARGGNRELLAAVCKRVAQGLLLEAAEEEEGEEEEGEEGGVLEEQAEMLGMLGHVLEEGLVTPTQHARLVGGDLSILCRDVAMYTVDCVLWTLYGAHVSQIKTITHTQECLVLLQHERVYAMFNAYTRTGDADAFCDGLTALGDGAEGLIAVSLSARWKRSWDDEEPARLEPA